MNGSQITKTEKALGLMGLIFILGLMMVLPNCYPQCGQVYVNTHHNYEESICEE